MDFGRQRRARLDTAQKSGAVGGTPMRVPERGGPYMRLLRRLNVPRSSAANLPPPVEVSQSHSRLSKVHENTAAADQLSVKASLGIGLCDPVAIYEDHTAELEQLRSDLANLVQVRRGAEADAGNIGV